jgi:sugar lactone lactonase YvrE
MRRIIIPGFIFIVILIFSYLFVSHSPVDPVAYHPQKKPAMTGALAPNDLLLKADQLVRGKVDGPEDIAFDAQGRIYSGTADGRIVRVLPYGPVETYAKTGGRPLCMRFNRTGGLIVCDASLGLISVDQKGSVTVLANSAGGRKFRTTDALDIARDGTVYFTDGSDAFGLEDHTLDMIEARPHGRLMRYSPSSKKAEILIKGLCFANGVALSRDEDFVLVNETFRYRVWRYWLKGAKAGTSEIFIDNLPGLPDNISSNGKGTFWLALYTVRNDLLDFAHGYPFLKSILGRIPHKLWVRPARYGFVVSLDETGRITGSLHDQKGENLYIITSAVEHEGCLYMGSVVADRIGRYRLDK